MLNFYSRLTPAQQLVISGVASLAGTALVVTLAATWQLYQQGQVDVGVLINFAVLTFATLISKSLHDYVPAHVQLELQAARDSESQAHDGLARSQAITQTVINKNAVASSQSQNGPLVVIHAASVTPVSPPDVSKLDTVSVPVPVDMTEAFFPPGWRAASNPTNLPQVSDMATQGVPVAQLPFPEPVDIPAQNTMPEIPALHFGDSGLVPLVTP